MSDLGDREQRPARPGAPLLVPVSPARLLALRPAALRARRGVRRALSPLAALVLLASAAAAAPSPAGAPWTPTPAPIQTADAAAGALLGYAVAISGDHALVGAPFDRDKRGAAYVFRRTASGWVQVAQLAAADGEAGDAFGISVAIDGDRALVGAYRRAGDRGAAYVFQRTASGWAEAGRLTADGAPGDQFGVSVSLSGDRAAVGAHGRGAAYVFRQQGGAWAQEAEVGGAGAGDAFGWSVSLWKGRLAVGAHRHADGRGAAYVFGRTASGWTQEARLEAADGGAADNFGVAVSLWDGAVLVGAPFHAGRRGAAYVFGQTGGAWAQTAKLTAPDAAADDYFGWSAALQGGRALVGSRLDDDGGSNSGGAYVFAQSGAEWAVERKLAEIAQSGDHAGLAVALTADHALVGAPYRDGGRGIAQAVSFAAPAAACAPGAPLSVSAFDPAGTGPQGETVELTNGSADADVDLAGCTLVALDPFTRAVTFAAPAEGRVVAGGTFTFATSGGQQTIPARSILDGPGALALVQGPAAVGDDVAALLPRLVVAVAYRGPDAVGRVGANGTVSAESFEEAFNKLAATPADPALGGASALSLAAWPNPVAGRATVSFEVGAPAGVRVSVYDALGREVAVLADQPYASGPQAVALDAAALPAGVYTVRAVAAAHVSTVRVTVVR